MNKIKRLQRTERSPRKRSLPRAAGHAALALLLLLLLILTFAFLWGIASYGNLNVEEIVFHMRMPLKGTAHTLVRSYLKRGLLPALLLFALALALFHPYRHDYWLAWNGRKGERRLRVLPLARPGAAVSLAVLVAWFGLLFWRADSVLGMVDFVRSQSQDSTFIAQEYRDAGTTRMIFPERPRNLITVYMESAETALQDKAHGGLFDVNLIPEMTRLAGENISFSQSELIQGAVATNGCEWTMGGLTAESGGIPLKFYAGGQEKEANNMGAYDAFLPGVTMLGDLLEAQGYHNVFMAGSDFDFGGRRDLYTQHGNYEILDYLYFQEHGMLPTPDYLVWWGVEDRLLYEYAREELTALAREGRPFHFAMLTSDTHQLDGYRCELCPDTYEEQYANVWACASAQIDSFVRWIQAQDFYENTTVVILGDHTGMQPDFYPVGDRLVYNVFINSAVQTDYAKNRYFNTMDFYPTTLASLGVWIEGGRLGLGTNMFTGYPTLSESYRYNYLNDELAKHSDFYDDVLFFP